MVQRSRINQQNAIVDDDERLVELWRLMLIDRASERETEQLPMALRSEILQLG
jgi:hypothetical protein